VRSNSNLGEDTEIPIKWLFTTVSISAILITFVVGLTAYVSKIEARVDQYLEMGVLIKDIHNDTIQIDRRLSRIEGKLDIKGEVK